MRILLVGLLLLTGCVVVPLEIKDGVRYDAKAFNWDKEKWIDVEVVFKDDEATIFFFDDWHEPRTVGILDLTEPKNPTKIETIDEERDVFWDIKILE